MSLDCLFGSRGNPTTKRPDSTMGKQTGQEVTDMACLKTAQIAAEDQACEMWAIFYIL